LEFKSSVILGHPTHLQLLDLNRGQGQTLPPLVNHPSTKPKLLAEQRTADKQQNDKEAN
jgi:hypothetical protein